MIITSEGLIKDIVKCLDSKKHHHKNNMYK